VINSSSRVLHQPSLTVYTSIQAPMASLLAPQWIFRRFRTRHGNKLENHGRDTWRSQCFLEGL